MRKFRPPPAFWISVVLWLLAGATYRDVPHYSFTEIDTPTILRVNRIEEPADVARIFTREFRDEIHEGVRFYRPLTALTHGVDQRLFGLDPEGMHRVDVALHGVATIALLWLALGVGMGLWPSTLAALLFLLHPLGVEVVPALARRGDVLALALLLVATALRFHGRARLALLFGAFAPLAKETAFVLPLVWGAGKGVRWRDMGREFAAGLAAVLPALLLRTLVVGGGGGYQRIAVNTEGLASSLLTLFDPFRLFGVWPSRLLFVLLLVAVVGRWLRGRDRALQLGVVWLVAALFLATLGGRIGSWYLYAPLPSVALLLALVARDAWTGIREKRRRAAPALAALLLLPCVLVPAPAWTPYPEWEEASRLYELWDQELLRHVDSGAMPEGEDVVLLGVPMQIGQGPGARFFTRAASVALGYTLQDGLWLRHGVDLPVWCAVQVHLHEIGGRYQILVEEVGEELWVRASGPVDIDGADRLAIWRTSQLPPYELRREPEEEALVFRDIRPSIWYWDGAQLVLWQGVD